MRISYWSSDVCSSDLEQVYDRADNYSFGEFHNNIESIVEGVQGNNDVTWQTERKADIGIEFSLFQGRFCGSVDYSSEVRRVGTAWVSMCRSRWWRVIEKTDIEDTVEKVLEDIP